jgi:hypothetical protein
MAFRSDRHLATLISATAQRLEAFSLTSSQVRSSHHGSGDNPNSLTKKPNIWPQPELQKFSELGACKVAGSIYGGEGWLRTPGAVRYV